MSGREVEGLLWPEGDPDGLRRIAVHASGIAGELDARRNFLAGLDPLGWLGDARDSFTISLAQNGHALGSGASAMRQAAGALNVLAGTVEQAQHMVLGAAAKLRDARDAAGRAQAKAQQLRADATQQANVDALLLAPMGGHISDPVAQQADAVATQAENDAATTQAHALDTERWAQGQAQTAITDVQRADRSCASQLEGLGLIQAPGSPALVCAGPNPAQPLVALSSLLLGSGSSTDGTLMGLLSQPPAPPPPPPKPVHKHHSWLKVLATGGLAIVTTGLTVVDIMQLGLDPATDAATVGTGDATLAMGGEALAGETAAGGATVTDVVATESTADVLAAEGEPAAGLGLSDGAADAPVDPATPSERPTWRDSEQHVSQQYKDQGYREQVSFKDGEEVPYGTKGSTRPELYKPGSSVEVKNYDVSTPQGQSNLVRNVSQQATGRGANLPGETTQSVVVDVRGQAVTPETLDELASRIASRSGGAIHMDQITFIR